MTTITSEPIVMSLAGEATTAYVFALQAQTNDAPLTDGQIEAARNAAKSVLELLGADVSAISAVVGLAAPDGVVRGRLVIDCAQEIDETVEEEVEIDDQGEEALEESA